MSHRRGLSHALIAEILRHFRGRAPAWPSSRHELDLTAARAAYEAAGFGQTHTIGRQEAWANEVT
jgi:hypothetical protein